MKLHAAFRRRKRLKIFHRANGQCEYCGCLLLLPFGTLDHRLPLSRGGSNRNTNLSWCCWSCNQIKGDIPEITFLKLMAAQKHVADPPWRPLAALIKQATKLAGGENR